MHFEQRLDTADRGTRAETRDARHRARIDPIDAYRQDARKRRLASPQTQIRGRIAERAAQFPAMDDATEHAVGTPQQARGSLKMALFQALAYRGAADAHRVDDKRCDLLDLKSMLATRIPQRLDIAGGLAAVAEIVADDDVLSVQAVDDQLLDELLRTHRTYALIEPQRHQALDAESLEGHDLLAPARQARRRTGRVDELLGTRLEHQHGGRGVEFGGAALQQRDHLLVAEMY